MVKILKWFANLLLIFVIIALAGYFVLRVTNKIEIYHVKTGSMEAKIHVGDYVLILKKSNYKVGDVVTYTSNNGFITHRIIEIDGNKVTTKGDANNTPDEVINAKIIIGKVIMSGGILNIIIKYKYLISGLVLSLYLFSCYFDSVKEEEKKEATEKIEEEDKKENNEKVDEIEEESTKTESEITESKEIQDKNTKEKKKEEKDELIDLIDEIKEELKKDEEEKKSKNKRKIEKL